MTKQERVEAFKAFKEANEDAKEKVWNIVEEALEIISNLYGKKNKGEVKINVVDALNIDFYYERILHAKYSVAKMPLYTVDMEKDGTEEEFGFAFQRLNDLMEGAKFYFGEVKHIISQYD